MGGFGSGGFDQANTGGTGAGVSSFNNRSGAVTLTTADVTAVANGTYDPLGAAAAVLGQSLQLPGATSPARFAGGTAAINTVPVTGTFAVGDFIISPGDLAVCSVAGSPGTWVNLRGQPLSGTGVATRVLFAGGTASGAPTAGAHSIGDFVISQDGHIFVCTAAGSPGTWVDAGSYGSGGGGVTSFNTRSGAVTLTTADVTAVANGSYDALGAAAAVLGQPLALSGATAPTRYAGGTATGHPTTGTFAVGDFVITADGHIFTCTAAGTPGTWVDAGSYGSGGGGLTSLSFTLATAVALSATSALIGTFALTTGTWLVNVSAMPQATGGTAATAAIGARMSTGVGVITGCAQTESWPPSNNGRETCLALAFQVVVTSAGNLVIEGQGSGPISIAVTPNSSTLTGSATGGTAVKIA